MAVSWIDIAGTFVGPGSYNYNVAGYPAGAQLFVNSQTGTDGRRTNIIGIGSVAAQSLGSQGPYGDPVKPLKSVFGPAGALSQCVSGRGDTIIVAPGHVETLATGAAIAIPSGVSIIGGGYGNARPVFQFTNASTFIQPSGSVYFTNLIFDLTQVASLTRGFNIATSGVQFTGCRIIQASVTNQAGIAIQLSTGGDDFVFLGSEIDGTAAAIAGGIAISNAASNNVNRPQIVNSLIHGQYATAVMNFASTGTSELYIEGCTVRQEHATTTFVISIPAGNTFLATFAYNNYLSVAAATGTATTIYNQATPGTNFVSAQNFVRFGGAAYAASTVV